MSAEQFANSVLRAAGDENRSDKLIVYVGTTEENVFRVVTECLKRELGTK